MTQINRLGPPEMFVGLFQGRAPGNWDVSVPGPHLARSQVLAVGSQRGQGQQLHSGLETVNEGSFPPDTSPLLKCRFYNKFGIWPPALD